MATEDLFQVVWFGGWRLATARTGAAAAIALPTSGRSRGRLCFWTCAAFPPSCAGTLTQLQGRHLAGTPGNISKLFPWLTLKSNGVWEEKLEGEVPQQMERCGVKPQGNCWFCFKGIELWNLQLRNFTQLILVRTEVCFNCQLKWMVPGSLGSGEPWVREWGPVCVRWQGRPLGVRISLQSVPVASELYPETRHSRRSQGACRLRSWWKMHLRGPGAAGLPGGSLGCPYL